MYVDQDALYRAMCDHEVSARRLGQLAGCSHQMIGHLINGRKGCTRQLAEAIAAALDRPLDDLFSPARPRRTR